MKDISRLLTHAPVKILQCLCLLFMLGVPAQRSLAQGVGIVDASSATYLNLSANHIDVNVEEQVAIVTSTQQFTNTLTDSTTFTFAFPMAEDASPIGIRWQIDDTWYRGIIEAVPQDTTLPGGGSDGTPTSLTTFLGGTPFYFDIEQHLPADSSIIVELTYVQLLPYAFGNVDFVFPNKYNAIQTALVQEQSFTFNLFSQREINSLDLLQHTAFTLENFENGVRLTYDGSEIPMTEDYEVRYALNQDDLGLFGFSTLLADSVVADEGLPGFFTFVAEPDASESSEAINKVFSLVIDRSGSMGGDKIRQARDAASFIVNNLNEGDQFNIVDFSAGVTNFRDGHVEFNEQNRDAALTYIGNLTAGGGTNISGALTVAITQFQTASTSTANLVIFFTDGRATQGETNTERILDVVENTANQTESDPILFTFGIGSDVDTQLLTRLASENGGLAEFLGQDELESRITSFYLQIRNPVLLNTSIAFDRTGFEEVVPAVLPNLYKGQQMIVSGRYAEPGPVNITLSGNAFGQPVSFSYALSLSDSTNTRYQFLTKVWAKQKIEQLLIEYYSLPATSSEAEAIKEEVVALSVAFGIITPFTSFQGGEEDDNGGNSVGVEEEIELATGGVTTFQIAGNYPNPFRTTTKIQIEVDQVLAPEVELRIYDSLGRLVRTLKVHVSTPGVYEVEWDGLSDAGVPVSAGSYIVVAEYGNVLWSHVMTLVR